MYVFLFTLLIIFLNHLSINDPVVAAQEHE